MLEALNNSFKKAEERKEEAKAQEEFLNSVLEKMDSKGRLGVRDKIECYNLTNKLLKQLSHKDEEVRKVTNGEKFSLLLPLPTSFLSLFPCFLTLSYFSLIFIVKTRNTIINHAWQSPVYV